MSDDLSCGTGVNCQEHEEKTWLKHKNVNSFSNDLTIIDYVHYVYSFFSQFFGQDTIIIYYPGKIHLLYVMHYDRLTFTRISKKQIFKMKKFLSKNCFENVPTHKMKMFAAMKVED